MKNPYKNTTNGQIYKLSWALLIAHHVGCIIVGLAGFVFEASPSIERSIGNSIFTWLWSFLFVLFGGLALFARLKERVSAELWAIGSIAFARALWCAIIIVNAFKLGTTTGIQIGLALGATSLFMAAWAGFTIVWVRTGLLVISGRGQFPTEILQERLLAIAKEVTAEERKKMG